MPQHPARRSVLRATAVLVFACGSLSSSACGSNVERPIPAVTTPAPSSLTAPQIIAEAQRSLAQSSSVHITGKYSEAGKPVEIDMRILADKKATGSVTTAGVRVELRRIGDRLFVQGGDAFLDALGPRAKATKGKWLVGPVAQADRGLANLTDLDRFSETLAPGKGTLTKEGVRPLAGQPAVSVRSSTGARLWVADVGGAHPLRVERTGEVTGFLDYRDYDAPVTVTPPSPTVDLASVTS
jgi:hypothetical protein